MIWYILLINWVEIPFSISHTLTYICYTVTNEHILVAVMIQKSSCCTIYFSFRCTSHSHKRRLLSKWNKKQIIKSGELKKNFRNLQFDKKIMLQTISHCGFHCIAKFVFSSGFLFTFFSFYDTSFQANIFLIARL